MCYNYLPVQQNLLSTYCMIDTVLDVGDTGKQTAIIPVLWSIPANCEKLNQRNIKFLVVLGKVNRSEGQSNVQLRLIRLQSLNYEPSLVLKVILEVTVQLFPVASLGPSIGIGKKWCQMGLDKYPV